jgi:hypothetical protein
MFEHVSSIIAFLLIGGLMLFGLLMAYSADWSTRKPVSSKKSPPAKPASAADDVRAALHDAPTETSTNDSGEQSDVSPLTQPATRLDDADVPSVERPETADHRWRHGKRCR